MADRRWIELEGGNDWDSIYYAPKGQRLTVTGSADHQRGVKLLVGPLSEYLCKLKDGPEFLVKLTEVYYMSGAASATKTIQNTGKDGLFAIRSFDGIIWRTQLHGLSLYLSEEEINDAAREKKAL